MNRKHVAICLVTALGASVLLAGVALDPYTWHRDTSHAVQRAPLWQTALAALEGALIVGQVWFAWRRLYLRAVRAMFAGLLVSLGANSLYVLRDGPDRFFTASGADNFLLVYLLLLAFRVVVLMAVLRLVRDGSPGAHADRAGGPYTGIAG